MLRIGLVLGAGGVAGRAYHAGVLAALEDHLGWDAREAAPIVGTSAGAIVGAMLRSGARGNEIAAHLAGEEVSPSGWAPLDVVGPAPTLPSPIRQFGWPPVSVGDVVNRARRGEPLTPGLVATCLLPRGICAVDDHTNWIEDLLRGSWPRASLWISAVEIPSLERVVWRSDAPIRPPIGKAVAASCAIPGYITPIRHHGREYVDGGCHSPTNADVLVEEPLDLVIVSSPMSVSAGAGRRQADLPLRRVWSRALHREAGALADAGTEVVTIEPTDAVDMSLLDALNDADELGILRAAYAEVRHGLLERRWPALERVGDGRQGSSAA